MPTVICEIDIQAPLNKVFEYYTNPDNIKEAWPHDFVKESIPLSRYNNEEGTEIRVKGEYLGRKAELILQVKDKQSNKRFVTEQKKGPFKYMTSIQEFNGNQNTTHVTHLIDYEFPILTTIVNFICGDGAAYKIETGIEHASQTVKKNLEPSTVAYIGSN